MFVHLQHFATALIAQAAEEPAARGCTDNNALFLPIVMMAILYFVWIVPERKKHKAQQSMVENLKRGDEVITASGLFGTITDITDKT
jgi:preprotein translocase subunit YajC